MMLHDATRDPLLETIASGKEQNLRQGENVVSEGHYNRFYSLDSAVVYIPVLARRVNTLRTQK